MFRLATPAGIAAAPAHRSMGQHLAKPSGAEIAAQVVRERGPVSYAVDAVAQTGIDWPSRSPSRPGSPTPSARQRGAERRRPDDQAELTGSGR